LRRASYTFDGIVYELGEPLLFQAASWLTVGPVADGFAVNLHPMAFAAWFGLLATALNLFPMGQLDGGHISYAVLGQKSTLVTVGTVACLLVLSFLSSSWIFWTVLTVGLLVVFGPRHPRTPDEHVPLDPARLWLAAFAVWGSALVFTAVAMFLPGMLERTKFTDVLVAHAHLAMAGMLTAFDGLLLLLLGSSRVREALARPLPFLLWQAGAVGLILALAAAGTIEAAAGGFAAPHRSAIGIFYGLRWLGGAAMLAASWLWLGSLSSGAPA